MSKFLRSSRFSTRHFPKKSNHSLRNTAAVINAIKTASAFAPAQTLEAKVESYEPKYAFADFAINSALKNNIASKHYLLPTPIQDQTIPLILQGRDVIGIANTGTGKTAAFLIPLINKVLNHRNERVLILTPTRELALQIKEELYSFNRGMNLFTALCVGGMNINKQIYDVKHDPHFVIGTPGRIKDLLERKVLNLSVFHNVVIDEADRMVDIGFIGEIKHFISLLPQDRQSLFFSATLSGKVQEILNGFVKNPVTVSVKHQETSENVEQKLVKVIDRQKKVDQLHDLLISKDFEKVLIFGRTKHGIEKLERQLEDRGFKVGSIHGNKRQTQRFRVLEQFKRNQINILLATDVASRGLDIRNISHVINYDVPETYEDYVHRIGRTGRIDQKGIALTFVD